MKSLQVIVSLICNCLSSIFEEIDSRMRCDKILKQGNRNIKESVLDDFIYLLVLT